MKKILLTICISTSCAYTFSQEMLTKDTNTNRKMNNWAFHETLKKQKETYESYKINESASNNIKLSGTSTLHNWDMQTKKFTSKANFEMDGKDIKGIKSLVFAVIVQNLKSDEKGLDKNAYKALKSTEFKTINYKLFTAQVSLITENNYLVKTTGKLTVAGDTQLVNMDVGCKMDNNDTIQCTGIYKLKMTDYGVKPPTFMLGAMKTGNDLTLDFTFNYSK